MWFKSINSIFSFIIRRNLNYVIRITLRKNSSKGKDENDVISVLHCLGVDSSRIGTLINKFKLADVKDLKYSYLILWKTGFSNQYICSYMKLLTIHCSLLENYIKLFKECGFYHEKIGPAIISLNACTNRISLLKLFNYLPQETIISEKLLCQLKLNPDFNIEINESNTISDVYQEVCRFYFQKKLKFRNRELNYIMKTHFSKRWTSLETLENNLNILLDIVGFTSEDLKEKMYLLHSNSESLLTIIKLSQDEDVKLIISKNPNVLLQPNEKILEMLKLFQDHEISISNILRNLWIFTKDYNSVKNQLANILKSPLLNVFIKNRKLFSLIKYNQELNERLLILKDANMKCYNIKLLIGNNFIKHILNGQDRVTCEDIVSYISVELKIPLICVREQIFKNPYVSYVPILTVKHNMEYLRYLGFNYSEIFSAVQILLYPRIIVKDCVQKLLLNILMPTEIPDVQQVDRKYYLLLCLYYIEKRNHFTGSGVWSEIEIDSSGIKDSLC